MNIDNLLKLVKTQERVHPDDGQRKQFRAVYQKDDATPAVVLTGWVDTLESAMELAAKHIEGGILEGKPHDFVDKDGDGEIDVVEDIKDLFAKLFSIDQGNLMVDGTKDEIIKGLRDVFNDFEEAGSPEAEAINNLVLSKGIGALKALQPTGKLNLTNLLALLTNPEGAGTDLLKKLIAEPNDEKKSLFDWFTNDYYTGLNQEDGAPDIFDRSILLRKLLADLLTGARNGLLPKAKGIKLPEVGNTVDVAKTAAAGVAAAGLGKLFSLVNGKLNFNGPEDDLIKGIFDLFDFDGLDKNTADISKVALGNAIKTAKRASTTGSFDLDDVNDVLTNVNQKGEGLLDKLLKVGTPELKDENERIVRWFNDDYYTGLKGTPDATNTFKLTAWLRDKLAGMIDDGKKGILPAALAGLGAAVGGVKDVFETATPVAKEAKPVEETVKPAAEPVRAAVAEEGEKKRSKWPWLLCAGALASLPFWAIPYKVNVNLPDNATIENMPTSVKFYENVELPTPKVDGKTFEGWFTDPELTNKIDRLHFTLGGKSLYPKFVDGGTGETPALSFDLLKDKFTGLELLIDSSDHMFVDADDTVKASFDGLKDKLAALKEKLLASEGASEEELRALQTEIEDVENEMNKLTNEALAGVGADTEPATDGTGTDTEATGTDTEATEGTGTDAGTTGNTDGGTTGGSGTNTTTSGGTGNIPNTGVK